MTIDTRPRTLDDLIAFEASQLPNDVLGLEEIPLAAWTTFANTITTQNNALSLTGEYAVDPEEARAFLGHRRLAGFILCVEGCRDSTPTDIIAQLVFDQVGALDRRYLDTHAIPWFLGAVIAAALVAHSRWPELCRAWLEEEDA